MNINKIAQVLLVIGGLNWLLTAFGYGIGNWLSPVVGQVIYVIIGLAAIYKLFPKNA